MRTSLFLFYFEINILLAALKEKEKKDPRAYTSSPTTPLLLPTAFQKKKIDLISIPPPSPPSPPRCFTTSRYQWERRTVISKGKAVVGVGTRVPSKYEEAFPYMRENEKEQVIISRVDMRDDIEAQG